MTRLISAIIVLWLLAAAQHALAWGREGHVIVSEIAGKHLTPQARTTVQQLLDLEPEPKNRNFAYAALWPDLIKSSKHPEYRKYRFTRPLHYVNVAKSKDPYEPTRDCPTGQCVVEAVRRYTTQMREATDPQTRLVALKFLAHFVGDVHQPLHVGYKSDRGGNDVAVEFFNQKTNLHRVWDTMILRRDGASGKRLKRYAEKIADSSKDKDCATWCAITDPAACTNEARPCLDSHVYALLPRDGQIGEEYQRAALPVVRRQLQRAGVRLAAILNAVHDEAAASGCGCGKE